METTETRSTVYACPEHAPAGVLPEPNDDGRPSCSVCRTATYAVKPYLVRRTVLERGYWVTSEGERLFIADVPGGFK